jgi:hypothetical protein
VLTGALTLPGFTSTGTSSVAGFFGVGTSSPSDMLAVNGPIFLADVSPAATTNRLYSNAGSLYWAGSLIGGGAVGNWTTEGTNVWRVGGNVGIGTTSPVATLSVVGNGYLTGALTAASLNAVNATTTNLVATNATSTNLFATTASSTNLFAQTASFGTLSLESTTGYVYCSGTAACVGVPNQIDLSAYVRSDGSDQSTNLATAFARCSSGGEIIVDAAYTYSTTLVLPSGCDMEFAGTAGKLIYTGSADALQINNSKNITLQSPNIDITGAGPSAVALHIRGLRFGSIDTPRIRINGTGQAGIVIETSASGGNNWGAYLIQISNPDILGDTVNGGGYGIRTLQTSGDTIYVTNLTILDGWAKQVNYGLYLRNVAGGRVSGFVHDTGIDSINVANSSDIVFQPGELGGSVSGYGIDWGTGNSGMWLLAPNNGGVTPALGYQNNSVYTPQALNQGVISLYGSNSDQAYAIKMQSIYNYGQSFLLQEKGSGGFNDLMDFGERQGYLALNRTGYNTITGSTGNVGIGTTSPLAKLDVAGTDNATAPLFRLSSVASYATTTRFLVTNFGNVGIGTTSPFALLSVQGDGFFDGNLTAANITATGTLQAANVLATSSSTLQNFTALFATTSQATTTSLALTSLSNALLFANSNGSIIGTTTLAVNFGGTGSTTLTGLLKGNGTGEVQTAVAGVDYATPSQLAGNTFRDWNVVNGYLTPTTTLGIIVNASSTIGSGTGTGGLTVSGNSTTTGMAYFAGNVDISNSSAGTAFGAGQTSRGLLLSDITTNSGIVGLTLGEGGQNSNSKLGWLFNMIGVNTYYNYTSDAMNQYSTSGGFKDTMAITMSADNARPGGNRMSFFTGSNANPTERMSITTTGNIGIGTSTPYSKLTVWGTDTASTSPFAVVNSASTTVFAVYDNGNATYSGSIFQSSDQRLKRTCSRSTRPLPSPSLARSIPCPTPALIKGSKA